MKISRSARSLAWTLAAILIVSVYTAIVYKSGQRSGYAHMAEAIVDYRIELLTSPSSPQSSPSLSPYIGKSI